MFVVCLCYNSCLLVAVGVAVVVVVVVAVVVVAVVVAAAKQPFSTTAIKKETNHYLLFLAVVNGHFAILISQFGRNPDRTATKSSFTAFRM